MWIDFVPESETGCRWGHLEGLGAPECSLGVGAPSLSSPDGDYGAYGWRERDCVGWREGLHVEESCVLGRESPAPLACPLTPRVEPDPQYLLFFCRLATGLDGMRIENKGHISTLTFFNVSEKDYGNYTCVATNKLGITNASITLYGECRRPGRGGAWMGGGGR